MNSQVVKRVTVIPWHKVNHQKGMHDNIFVHQGHTHTHTHQYIHHNTCHCFHFNKSIAFSQALSYNRFVPLNLWLSMPHQWIRGILGQTTIWWRGIKSTNTQKNIIREESLLPKQTSCTNFFASCNIRSIPGSLIQHSPHFQGNN